MKKTLIFIATFALIAGTASVASAQVGYGGGVGGRSGDFAPGFQPVFTTNGVGQVLGASAFNFSSNLGLGAQGQDVVELQNHLRAEGFFSANSTGYFGPITQAAVKAYQNAHGISNTGFVGPLTLARLNASTGAVLGASTDSETESRIAGVRNQLAAVITQLIQLLQSQINALR